MGLAKSHQAQSYRDAVLDRMTPGELIAKACELSDHVKRLLKAGLRLDHPNATETELQGTMLRRDVARLDNTDLDH